MSVELAGVSDPSWLDKNVTVICSGEAYKQQLMNCVKTILTLCRP
jgi:hypothetical protein